MHSFVIWFQHRSGSSHLVSLLNSHPEIDCKGEVFGGFPIENRNESTDPRQLNEDIYRRVLNRFPGRELDPSDEASVAELATLFSANSIRGFKYKFPSQAKLYPEVTNRLVQLSKEIRLIVLTRKDYLRRALSVINLRRVQSLTERANSNEKLELPPMEVEPAEVIRLINYYITIEDEFVAWSNQFQNRMELDYDQLINRETDITHRMQEFLGTQETFQLESKTQKITPIRLRDSVSNFSELKAELLAADIEYQE